MESNRGENRMARKISTKKVSSNIEDGLRLRLQTPRGLRIITAEKIDGTHTKKYNKSGTEFSYVDTPDYYALTEQNIWGDVLKNTTYATLEALAVAMKELADLRTWKRLDIEA
jgi:hypothetical protein